MKNRLDYFPHEAKARNHWKFKSLRAHYGKDGWAMYGKFWALNEIIVEEEHCRLDLSRKSKLMAIAVELDLSTADFDGFIQFLESDVELIKRDENGIYTDRTDEVYQMVQKRRVGQNERKRKERLKKQLSDDKVPLGDKPVHQSEELKPVLLDIMAFFGFNEIAHTNKYREAFRALKSLQSTGHLDHFKRQWYFYKSYKTMSEEQVHSFPKFISSGDPLSGGWNDANWEKKFQDFSNKTGSNDPSRTVQ